MPSRDKDFRPEDVRRALLWCNRHCCLCGKQCGVAIELAHIDQNGPNDLDNGIPVCFDCHLAMGGYNDVHPRGRKLRPGELKARRDQMYELQTRHLVPHIRYEVTQSVFRGSEVVNERTLPDIGFFMIHQGGPYPVRASVCVTLKQGKTLLRHSSHHYDGTFIWNLNPGFGVNGHFQVPKRVLQTGTPLRARVDVVLFDIYEYQHRLLSIGFVNELGKANGWYLEPSLDALGISKPGGRKS